MNWHIHLKQYTFGKQSSKGNRLIYCKSSNVIKIYFKDETRSNCHATIMWCSIHMYEYHMYEYYNIFFYILFVQIFCVILFYSHIYIRIGKLYYNNKYVSLCVLLVFNSLWHISKRIPLNNFALISSSLVFTM